MIRFISFLLGKPFDPCKSCQTLKEQIEFERSEKRQLLETLLGIVKPKEFEAPPVEINQIAQSSALFSRRRAALEEQSRTDARILAEKKYIASPDKLNTREIRESKQIKELEKELGIEEEPAN